MKREETLLLLKSYRVKRGLLQWELAERCGLSKQAICDIETGKKRPWRNTLVVICDELELTAADRLKVFRHFGHEDVDMDDIFFALSRARVEMGLSQAELGTKIGASRGKVHNFEKGRGVSPELTVSICAALELSAEDTAAIMTHFDEDNEHKEPADGVHTEGGCEQAPGKDCRPGCRACHNRA